MYESLTTFILHFVLILVCGYINNQILEYYLLLKVLLLLKKVNNHQSFSIVISFSGQRQMYKFGRNKLNHSEKKYGLLKIKI
jgi:hypothetical protein